VSEVENQEPELSEYDRAERDKMRLQAKYNAEALAEQMAKQPPKLGQMSNDQFLRWRLETYGF
jgi:hypothetical protein